MRVRLIVGLTGSFGSGKSTAAKIFKKLGARKVISADEIAHEVFLPKSGCLKKIRALFTPSPLSSPPRRGRGMGEGERRKIAREMFTSPKKRKALETLIHPYVRRRIVKEISNIKRGIVILEIPLLFEAKFDRFCDVTITVTAGKSNILKRLMREGFSRNEINWRLKAQLSEKEKMRRADFIINNKGSKKLLERNARQVWQELMPREKE